MNDIDHRSAAIELARGAGDILRARFVGAEALDIDRKGTIDLVTDADHAAEAFLLGELRQRYPDHAILAEESGAHAGKGEHRWIVDPLDGTVNFAHRLGHFSVLLALQQRTDAGWRTQLAVSFDPMRDELFVAERGGGATLNGAAITVSPTTRLIDAVLATGFAYDRLHNPEDNHAEFCRLNLLTQGVRRFGSAGLDLAWTACGRFDGFWERGLRPWDVAGGALLITEAGGTICGYGGVPFAVDAGTIVAAGSALHAPLLAALASANDHPIGSRRDLADHLPADIAEELS